MTDKRVFTYKQRVPLYTDHTIQGPPFFDKILDLYPGAAGAYSLRQLKGEAIECVVVRRSSDNTETTIGFVDGSLDITTLLSFVGAGNGFVKTWKDQSGNGLDVSQTTPSKQPRIVNSGTLETFNGKPAIRFIRSSVTALTGGNILSAGSNPLCFYVVANVPGSNQAVYAKSFPSSGSGRYSLLAEAQTYFLVQDNSGAQHVSTGQLWTNQTLFYCEYIPSTHNKIFANNLLKAEDTSVGTGIGNISNSFYFGQYDTSTSYNHDGYIQEFIGYLTDKSANKDDISGNINAYYTIY